MKNKVLVIDDNLDILHLVEIILKTNGFEVLISPRGDDVFTHTNTFKPQIILLDVYLSGFDGKEICKELKANAKTSHIPVIMFSAHTKYEEILKSCNAEDFIAKPFEINELVQKINTHLISQTH